MSDPENWTCNICANVGLEDGEDGFYYCVRCGAQSDEFIEMGVANNFIGKGAVYLACHSCPRNTSTVKAEPLSQPIYDSPNPGFFDAEATPKAQRPIKTKEYFDDGVGPSGLEDFGGSKHPFVSMKVTETTLNLQNRRRRRRRDRNRPNKIRKHE